MLDDATLERLQARLGVRFRDCGYIQRALTHRSAVSENGLDSYERLEFLGDAVVGLVISENLFKLFPERSEGDLAKSKSYVVSETSLAEAAAALGLEEFIQMSVGEATSGGRKRRSILADAFEAVVAAIYLDCGILAARRFVRAALLPTIRSVSADLYRGDYKSSLQERTQARDRAAPLYRIVAEKGRDHEKIFVAEAVLHKAVIGQGEGGSKKEAEQAAARDALERYLSEPEESPIPDENETENRVQ